MARLMPNFAMAYAVAGPKFRGSTFLSSGGERVRMWGLRPWPADDLRCGSASFETSQVPRALMLHRIVSLSACVRHRPTRRACSSDRTAPATSA